MFYIVFLSFYSSFRLSILLSFSVPPVGTWRMYVVPVTAQHKYVGSVIAQHNDIARDCIVHL